MAPSSAVAFRTQSVLLPPAVTWNGRGPSLLGKLGSCSALPGQYQFLVLRLVFLWLVAMTLPKIDCVVQNLTSVLINQCVAGFECLKAKLTNPPALFNKADKITRVLIAHLAPSFHKQPCLVGLDDL